MSYQLDWNLFSPNRQSQLMLETHPAVALMIETEKTAQDYEDLFAVLCQALQSKQDMTLILVPASDQRNQNWLNRFESLDPDTLPDVLLIDESLNRSTLADLILLSQYVLIPNPIEQADLCLQALACERQVISLKTSSEWKEAIWQTQDVQQMVQTLDHLHQNHLQALPSIRAQICPQINYTDQDLATVAGKLLKTEIVAIFYWARGGSVFIQSLLDSHPEILTIIGGRGYAMMEYYTKVWPALQQLGIQGLEMAARHFCLLTHASHSQSIVKHYGSTTRRYLFSDEYPERQDKFIESFVRLGLALNPDLSHRPIPSNIFFLLMHYAFAAAIGQDIRSKHIILYQVHGPENISNIYASLQDFPKQKMIGAFRSPIRGFYSQLARWVQVKQASDPDYHMTDLLADGEYPKSYRHMLMGWQQIKNLYQQPIYPINLEKLHQSPRDVMASLAENLGIQWHDCLLESTAEGLPFVQESGVHQQINQDLPTFDPQRVLYTKWKNVFSTVDEFVLNGLLQKQLNEYDQQNISDLQNFMAKVLLFLPSQLELLAIQRFLIEKDKKSLHNTLLSIIERWFYSYLFIGAYPFFSTVENWNPNNTLPALEKSVNKPNLEP